MQASSHIEYKQKFCKQNIRTSVVIDKNLGEFIFLLCTTGNSLNGCIQR